MAEIVNANVVDVRQESKVSKAGRPFTVHSVVLDNGRIIETGFQQPFSVGAQFHGIVEKKYGKDVYSGPAPAGQVAQAAAPAAYSPPATSGPSREVAIIKQNALTNATNFVVGRKTHTGSDDDVARVLEVAAQFAEFAQS